MSINLGEINDARSQIVMTARKMLAGELSYIEGSRVIIAILPDAQVDNMDDFIAFEGIAAETDRFPMGAHRDQWQTHALELMQPELNKAEDWAKAYGEPACIAIIERLTARSFEL
jgi:hypothetical protein